MVITAPIPETASTSISTRTACGSFIPFDTSNKQEVSSVHYVYYDTHTQSIVQPSDYDDDPNDTLNITNRRFQSPIYQDYCRWCVYPGEALLQKVALTINGNPIDSYDNMTMIVH